MDANRKTMDGENDGPTLITGCRECGRERMPPAVSPGRVRSWVLVIGVGWGLLGILPCSAMGGQEQPASPFKTRSSQREALFFMAIAQVESRGCTDAVGDGGRSLGTYQIQRAYWSDGGGDPKLYHRLAFDNAASRRVMVGYWRKYCPAALAAHDWQTLARTHNGGPAGAGRAQTAAYWLKVRHAMGSSMSKGGG
jgi:hypothetical protein